MVPTAPLLIIIALEKELQILVVLIAPPFLSAGACRTFGKLLLGKIRPSRLELLLQPGIVIASASSSSATTHRSRGRFGRREARRSLAAAAGY